VDGRKIRESFLLEIIARHKPEIPPRAARFGH
jgi:hypothetical protein